MLTPRSHNTHIRNARLQHSAAMGETIADGILAIWSGLKRIAAYLHVQGQKLTKLPDSYSTSLRRPHSQH